VTYIKVMGNTQKFWLKNLKVRYHLEYLGKGKRIILKWMLEEL